MRRSDQVDFSRVMKIIDQLSYSWEKRLKKYFSFECRRDEFGFHITSQGSVVTLYGKMVMEIYACGSRGDAGKQAQVSFYFLISDGHCCWCMEKTAVGIIAKAKRQTWVGGNRSKEQDRKSELVLRSTYQIIEWDRNNSERFFFNVASNVHKPLLPWMQERSEAERRAIWPCLNVATWQRERSDRAIQQKR